MKWKPKLRMLVAYGTHTRELKFGRDVAEQIREIKGKRNIKVYQVKSKAESKDDVKEECKAILNFIFAAKLRFSNFVIDLHHGECDDARDYIELYIDPNFEDWENLKGFERKMSLLNILGKVRETPPETIYDSYKKILGNYKFKRLRKDMNRLKITEFEIFLNKKHDYRKTVDKIARLIINLYDYILENKLFKEWE